MTHFTETINFAIEQKINVHPTRAGHTFGMDNAECQIILWLPAMKVTCYSTNWSNLMILHEWGKFKMTNECFLGSLSIALSKLNQLDGYHYYFEAINSCPKCKFGCGLLDFLKSYSICYKNMSKMIK